MYTPKIDAFGVVSINNHKIGNFRIIEVSETQIALFSETEAPQVFDLDGTYKTKARNLTATLANGDSFYFQRASCGCQQTAGLRGPRSKFIAMLTPADA